MSGTEFPPRADHETAPTFPVFEKPFAVRVNDVPFGNLIRAYDMTCGWVTVWVPVLHTETDEVKWEAQTMFGKIELFHVSP